MPLPRPASPKALLADIRALIAQRSRHQLIAGVLALLIPAFFIVAFIHEATATVPGEQVIYARSWNANRTDEQIKADQKKAQAEKDANAKERQRQFQKLADQLGIE
jgi:mannitol-specific phosphotransferase system IIBC component